MAAPIGITPQRLRRIRRAAELAELGYRFGSIAERIPREEAVDAKPLSADAVKKYIAEARATGLPTGDGGASAKATQDAIASQRKAYLEMHARARRAIRAGRQPFEDADYIRAFAEWRKCAAAAMESMPRDPEDAPFWAPHIPVIRWINGAVERLALPDTAPARRLLPPPPTTRLAGYCADSVRLVTVQEAERIVADELEWLADELAADTPDLRELGHRLKTTADVGRLVGDLADAMDSGARGGLRTRSSQYQPSGKPPEHDSAGVGTSTFQWDLRSASWESKELDKRVRSALLALTPLADRLKLADAWNALLPENPDPEWAGPPESDPITAPAHEQWRQYVRRHRPIPRVYALALAALKGSP